MSKPKSPTVLAERLATLLVEILNHPKTEAILEEAGLEAHHDSGAESRHSGDLIAMIAQLGRHVAESAEADLRDLAEHYADEAECADHSEDRDHTPAECEQYAKEYEAGADGYFEAGLAFDTVAKQLRKDLNDSGI
jgi:hypothetical protein